MPKMGFQFGLESNNGCGYGKREFRWMFTVPGVAGDNSPNAVNALPPEKAARPSMSFKEIEINHLIEDVYYPAKPEWKPVQITLYDLQKREHPVFKWIKENVYDPQQGKFFAPASKELIKTCTLTLYDGCGQTVETWTYEDAWPQAVNFRTLDMSSSNLVLCELTLRYARAYLTNNFEIRPSQS